MKRPLALLAAVAILMAPLAGLASTPRHVNPAEIPGEMPSPPELLALYSAVANATTAEDYAEASRLLRQALKVYSPEDLRYILGRFHELLGSELGYLNETRSDIELAHEFLTMGLLSEARAAIYGAAFALAKANITHADLKMVAGQLSGRLPLGEVIAKFGAVIEEYRGRLSNLTEVELPRMEALLKTSLSIRVAEGEVLVGSSASVAGNLTLATGEPLPNRTVALYFDGKLAGAATTGEGGAFSATIRVPHVYKPEATIYAVFTPLGPDVGVLAPSKSNEVTIGLLYLTLNITVHLDKERAMPTEAFSVLGSVGVPGLAVRAEAFGEALETTADWSGAFNFTFTVPESAGEGAYPIEVSTYASGVIAPSRASTSIEVYRLPLDVAVEAPPATLAGLAFEVGGTVRGPEGPLSGVRVTVEAYGTSRVVSTDGAGRFKVELRPSLTCHTGWYAIRVTAEPPAPWYRPSSAEREVLTLNPYVFFLIAALAIVLLRSIRAAKKPKPPELEARLLPPSPPKKPTRAPVGIPSIYCAAADTVAMATGVALRSSDTVREYLARVRPLLGHGVAEPFEKLTYMLEAEVYAGIKQGVAEATRFLGEIRARLGGRA